MRIKALTTVIKSLRVLKDYPHEYQIPAVWAEPEADNSDTLSIEPFRFFTGIITRILESSKKRKKEKSHNFSKNEVVIYNMLIRYALAFDHEADGKLADLPGKLKDNGTFLKAMALLPYLEFLGINTVYLLPVCERGIQNKKGTLGSPYSVKNPYKIDTTLAENIIGIDAETQFSAFIEAAHILGMKVVLEFVFRTASLDSELAVSHPDWFYWLKEDYYKKYMPPKFNSETLHTIKEKIAKGNFTHLPEPGMNYRKIFSEIPVETLFQNDKIIGICKNGSRCLIPSAFADWPPDDTQPLWSDITYLRLFKNRAFNYIAYNTVRMYDSVLDAKRNIIKPLWKYISNIIPFYRQQFGIDGVMFDMGHALPASLRNQIVRKAREKAEDFIIWEENFTLTPKSAEEGYDAAVGYICFDAHIPEKLQQFTELLENKGVPIPYFSTPETHNTPRAATRKGGTEFSKMIFALNCIMPGLPFIHAGFELGVMMPINTGLGFEPEALDLSPADKVPLFAEAMMNWQGISFEILKFFKKMLEIRKKYIVCSSNFDPATFIKIDYGNDYIIAFVRKFGEIKFYFACNMNPSGENEVYLEFQCCSEFRELIRDKTYKIPADTGTLNLKIEPYEVICGLLK